MRRKARDASQTNLNGFMDKVEAATAVLEETAAVEPRIIDEFLAKPDPVLVCRVTLSSFVNLRGLFHAGQIGH